MKIILDNFHLKPKARPRIGRGGHVYSPTGKHESGLAWEIKAYLTHNYPDFRQFSEYVRVSLDVQCRALTGDLDNYEKTVFDALQKSGVLANDRQIRETRVRIAEGDVNRITIEIDHLASDKPRIAREYRENGMSLRVIASRLNCSYWQARQWCLNTSPPRQVQGTDGRLFDPRQRRLERLEEISERLIMNERRG